MITYVTQKIKVGIGNGIGNPFFVLEKLKSVTVIAFQFRIPGRGVTEDPYNYVRSRIIGTP